MFITLEGMDGSGKTTVIQRLKKDLEAQGYSVVLTREPGGLEICEKIRSILLDKDDNKIESWTEALLFIAARKEHLEKLIKPELEKGNIVISDRFLDSTSAYQGGARNLGVERIQSLQEEILGNCLPNLTLYFKLSFEEAEKRISKRLEDKNRLDEETQLFKEKVKEAFEKIVIQNPERVKVVDASLDENGVYESSIKIIREELSKWKK
ncbi:dTMP kinase [Mesoplasma corruscae]|uniref:Thymidylate kinase n=1 Tax=Mesoplasma corruscae TaxID=216874 RepID=A0A2S5RHA9_9MOLU|nr:dTMP kinase [Mesoplasma corruscae]PPE06678.1 thymidylate kinase [Mesoplasma corruscae]